MRFRVLWTDAAGQGRWTDVDAASYGAAAWDVAYVAMADAGRRATFEDIDRIDANGDAP